MNFPRTDFYYLSLIGGTIGFFETFSNVGLVGGDTFSSARCCSAALAAFSFARRRALAFAVFSSWIVSGVTASITKWLSQ